MQIKPSLQALKPYRPNKQAAAIMLDANESPNYLFDALDTLDLMAINRYPDSDALMLKEALAKRFNIDAQSLIIGSGSSELIELVIKTFVKPFGKIVSLDPSFSMYQVYSIMHSAQFVKVPLEPPFEVDVEALIKTANIQEADLIIVCNPNNPTGSLINKLDLIRLHNETRAALLIDEAYMDFTDESASLFREATKMPRLIVTRTFSKAYGLAGARVGYLRAANNVVETLNKVKTPYNINSLSMRLATQALEKASETTAFTKSVQTRRTALKQSLDALGIMTYPAHGNFIFIRSVSDLALQLLDVGIRIRDYTAYQKGFFRITVGTEKENQQLMKALKEVLSCAKQR